MICSGDGHGLNPLQSLSGVQKQTRLEIISFDIHSCNIIMNLFIFGITNGFPAQAFDVRSEIQVFPFNLPCHILPNIMPVVWQISFICPPIVRKIQSNGDQGQENK
jgi:hypothetical protein